MITAFNTMFKNEERLLSEVLPIWEKYPIDLFVFYNDNSTDSSVEVIKKILPKNRYVIINHRLPKFNESYQRQAMIDVSREQDVDYIFSIDCDELLTSNIVENFEEFIKIYDQQDMMLYWYNSVNNTLNQYRNDPQYVNNYRTFVLPLKHTSSLNVNDWKYHTPRTPYVNLPKNATKDYGVLHLQALDKKFYAIKQLWYKHYELVNYNHSVDFINSRYDIVVNNLDFQEKEIDNKLIEGISINPNIFDGLEIEKGYLDFIHKNYNEKLVTFGKEFL
jgi:hypothetical protein